MISRVLRHTVLFAALLGAGFAHAGEPELIDAQKWLEQTKVEKNRRMLNGLLEIKNRLEQASQIKTRLLLQNDDDINAFASELEGEKVIVFNLGLIETFEDDRDAIAAVYAHELAHHAKDHIGKGKSTSTALGVLGALVGAAIDYKLGGGRLGSRASGFAATLLDRKFNRDQEREADSAGIPWLVAAGYNPQGAIRMHRTLLAQSDNEQFSMMQTHPTSEERIERLEKLIRDDPAAVQLAKVDKARLFEAPPPEQQAASSSHQHGPGAKTPDAKLLEPIEGVTLDAFAKISNELTYQQNAAAVYRKHGISADKYQRVSAGFTARMAADQSFALSEHYSGRFLAASQGPYARYGTDVAQAMKGGRLKESPPITLEQYVAISRQLQQQGELAADPKAMAQLLKPYRLSSYDWVLVQNWWGRKFNEDSQMMQRYITLLSQQEEEAS
ncbi:M48 family metalloprotease [Chitinimonas lacunae]|uniref:M48 family metalloprotease n=1 Tax=Chitinimonas lacunae TaxID=1963018 RepID=A0ABV8MX53_9NEIS